MKLKALFGDLQVDANLRVVNYKALGLKSPKLSKALLSRGFDETLVSLLVDLLRPTPLELTSAEVDVVAQSASSHFTSCQAPGRKENRTEEDVRAAELGLLYLAVTRTPQGFRYRVKIRRCIDPATGETVGWFLDREYGQGRPTLRQFANLLREAGEPSYNRLAYRDPRFEAEGWPSLGQIPVLVPSAELGYQDTFKDGPYSAVTFVEVTCGEVAPSDVGSINLPLRSHPWRVKGVLVDSLLTFLYGPREEAPTRRPEEVALARVLRRLRRENPHIEWRTRNGRHAVDVYYSQEWEWDEDTPPETYANVFGSFQGVDLLVRLTFDPEARRWDPRWAVFVTEDEYGDRCCCPAPPDFPGLTYSGVPIS